MRLVRALSVELTLTSLAESALYRLDDELADGPARTQFDRQRTVVDQLKLDRSRKSRVNGGSGYVYRQPDSRQAALALNPPLLFL